MVSILVVDNGQNIKTAVIIQVGQGDLINNCPIFCPSHIAPTSNENEYW